MWGQKVVNSCLMAAVFSVTEKVSSLLSDGPKENSCFGIVTRRNRGMSKSRIKTCCDIKTQWRLEERKAMNIHRASILSVTKFLLVGLAMQVREKKRQLLYPIQDVKLAERAERNGKAAQEHAGDSTHTDPQIR